MRIPFLPLFLVFIGTGISFAQTFPDKYHTLAEGVAELQALVSAHPSICSLDSIGYSQLDHLPVYAFKISDNVNVAEDEPAILFNGGVHADEILGPEVVLNFCNDIVTRYAIGDTSVMRYVNNFEIFCVPFNNPEGHTVVEEGDLDWRKNKADNNNNGLFDYQDGVDNNRNFDFGWNIDTGPEAVTPESLMYKGPFPYSEPENVCLAQFGQNYKPLVAVDYHSPTYGRSEVVYYNWYWYSTDGGHGYAPDEQSMHNIGIGFAGSIIDDAGDSTYEARRALVNKGDFKTYYYANFGTASFSCEISDTTIQDTTLVDSICQRHLAGMYYLLHRSGYARLTGVVTDSISGIPLDAEVEVLQATSVDINPRYARANTGRYDRLIDPGTYTLVFSKTGYNTRTISGVVVNNYGPTITNVRLVPVNPPPATPVLLYPADGISFADSSALNFDWSDALRATGYVIEIGLNSSFTIYLQIDSSLTLSTYRNSVLLYPGTFYWRITAYNANGFSARSETWQFSLTGIPPPDAPTLISPGDGFISPAPFLNFDWNDSNGADLYAIEIDDDILFASPVINDTAVTHSYFQNSDSLENGEYYWRVKARGEFGWSVFSDIWSFTIAVDTGGIDYTVGDVNHNGQVNGIDVIYFVNYLKGGPSPPLEVNGFYPEADVNGNCVVNGIDVSFLVNYFKGGPALIDGDCLR